MNNHCTSFWSTEAREQTDWQMRRLQPTGWYAPIGPCIINLHHCTSTFTTVWFLSRHISKYVCDVQFADVSLVATLYANIPKSVISEVVLGIVIRAEDKLQLTQRFTRNTLILSSGWTPSQCKKTSVCSQWQSLGLESAASRVQRVRNIFLLVVSAQTCPTITWLWVSGYTCLCMRDLPHWPLQCCTCSSHEVSHWHPAACYESCRMRRPWNKKVRPWPDSNLAWWLTLARCDRSSNI